MMRLRVRNPFTFALSSDLNGRPPPCVSQPLEAARVCRRRRVADELDDALAALHHTSRGIPRSINNLAIQALIATFADGKGIVDENATAAQRSAIEALLSGEQGGAAFEIFAAVTPHKLGVVSAPIIFESDRDARIAKIRIPGVGETRIEPIKNPVTGETHRARIDLVGGFEYEIAEVGSGRSRSTFPTPASRSWQIPPARCSG